MERNGFANRFERLVGFAVQALAIAGLGLLTAIAIAIVVDVLLRFGFSIPIEGLSEVIALVSAVTIASFFPMSLKLGGHAKIRFLGHAFGPKAEKWLETFGDLLAVLFFAALTWQFARYTIELGQSGERTWILQLAPGPWW
ncbi:TRAP transporter small permease, partial [Sulfitobacter sp. HI0129]